MCFVEKGKKIVASKRWLNVDGNKKTQKARRSAVARNPNNLATEDFTAKKGKVTRDQWYKTEVETRSGPWKVVTNQIPRLRDEASAG
jgi:hypothetical protein